MKWKGKVAKYKINGYTYVFEKLRLYGRIEFGYCSRLKQWGWLYSDHIHFENGEIILADRI